MKTTLLKKEIHQAIDTVNDSEILKAVYTILKKSSEEKSDSLLTEEQKAELDKTLTDHKAGKLKYYTFNQAKKIIFSKSKK